MAMETPQLKNELQKVFESHKDKYGTRYQRNGGLNAIQNNLLVHRQALPELADALISKANESLGKYGNISNEEIEEVINGYILNFNLYLVEEV